MTTFAASPWVEAVGRALVRSTWQGAAVALVLALALRALRRASPQSRYLAACLALASMVGLPVLTGEADPGRLVVRSEAPAGPRVVALDRPEVGGPVEPRADRSRAALPLAVAGWLAGVGVLSIRLAGGLVVASRRRRRGARALPAAWVARFERIKGRMGVDRAVGLLESSLVEVPTVIGWLRPAILVPASALTGLTPAELDAILAHELAHVRRHDSLINLFQCLAETLLFYHPCARWASAVIRQEREHCCDDLAIAASGDRLGYARALASMEGLRRPASPLSLAANGGTLLARIGRILAPEPKEDESMKPLITLGLLLAALILAPIGLARVAAQQPAPTPAPVEAPPPAARPDADLGRYPNINYPNHGIEAARQEPFSNRSYADIIADVDEVPAGRLMVGVGADASARLSGDVVVVEKPGAPGAPPSKIEVEADNVVIYVDPAKAPGPKAGEEDVVALDPPNEAEVWQELLRTRGFAPIAVSGDARIMVEKVGSKVDPVKLYPLAGPCHLVHVRYKATIWFDEKVRTEGPKPTESIHHREATLFINKDHLRRARPGLVIKSARHEATIPAPAPAAEGDDLDRKLDELSGKVEALRRDRQKGRQIRQQELDLLNRELDELQSRTPADPKKSAQVNPKPGRALGFQLAFPAQVGDPVRYFTFFIGPFW